MLVYNANIVNEGRIYLGWLQTDGSLISAMGEGEPSVELLRQQTDEVVDAKGQYLLPGAIDAHVHFREPGLTHKASIYSESRAAIAGGVTSFMDMPNTKPQTTDKQAWQEKCDIASKDAYANYAFYVGATNTNLDELKSLDSTRVCGVKLFMGSSTGNMLVNDALALEQLFREVKMPIAVHCEDEQTIQENIQRYRSEYGEDVPIRMHPLIRSREACLKSTEKAVALALKHHAKLHVLHVTTKEEVELFRTLKDNPHITAETCPHYLYFSDEDYQIYGSRIKCNPAIKTKEDRAALIQALKDGVINTIGTDHAPHLLEEKAGTYFKAVSGFPSIQHTLPLMFDIAQQYEISPAVIVQMMSHAPADIYQIEGRGYLRPGYYADFVLMGSAENCVSRKSLLYKCQWSPLEGKNLKHQVNLTVLNGKIVYKDGKVGDVKAAMPLTFCR